MTHVPQPERHGFKNCLEHLAVALLVAEVCFFPSFYKAGLMIT